MAQVFFARDGSGDCRTTDSTDAPEEIPIELVVSKLSGCEFTFHEEPPPPTKPEITASEQVPFKYVVLKIHQYETCKTFTNQGFYHIDEISPDDFNGLFNEFFNRNIRTV